MNTNSRAVQEFLPRLQKAFDHATLDVPDDLEVMEFGHQITKDGDQLDYLWYRLVEREGGMTYPSYRVIRLLRLESIPLNVRNDQGALARMRTVLRGVFNAGVDIVYLVAGIHHPERIGIVQCYGVVGQGESLDEAAAQALQGSSALEAAMSAAFAQIRLRSVEARIGDWISDALLEMPHGILAVGHPDPRENARGGNSELDPLISKGQHSVQEFTLQQNELVMTVLDRRRYLVSMLGSEANWVRNVQTAGGKAVLLHGKREEVQLEEVDVPLRAPILKAYLRIAPGARPHLPVDKDAPLAAFEEIAPRFPVFLIIPGKNWRE